jgi:hypothetical protein
MCGRGKANLDPMGSVSSIRMNSGGGWICQALMLNDSSGQSDVQFGVAVKMSKCFAAIAKRGESIVLTLQWTMFDTQLLESINQPTAHISHHQPSSRHQTGELHSHRDCYLACFDRHPLRATEARLAGRPQLDNEPRGRVVIWLPLRLARLRRERESVIVVLSASLRRV